MKDLDKEFTDKRYIPCPKCHHRPFPLKKVSNLYWVRRCGHCGHEEKAKCNSRRIARKYRNTKELRK